MIQRLLREPLLQFLLIGTGLFLLYEAANGGRSEAIGTRDIDSTPPATIRSSPASTRAAAVLNAHRLDAQ